MKQQKVLEVCRKGDDYILKIPAGTSGREVELALTQAFLGIEQHQQTIDPEFKVETLIEKIKGWIRCVKQQG